MQNIDIQRIKDQANSPDTFFFLLPEYKWKPSGNGYRAGKKSGISIYQKNGIWIVNAFNGDFEKHDLFGLVAELNNLDLTRFDDLLNAAGIICHAANLRLEDFLTKPLTGTPLAYQKPVQRKETHTPPPFIPNREREIKKSYSDFERAAPGSAPHNAAARYYQDKTGIEPDALNKYGIFPLQSLTDNYRNKRTFSGENFAFLYMPDTAGNIKVKRPGNARKVGYYQSTGNYVFGLHTLPDQDVRKEYTLIIAAGEDDTNAINYHFQKFGFCAICFNSESVNIRPEYLQQLRRDFKDVFCLFDNDETGKKWMLRNYDQVRINYIDLAPFLNNQKRFTPDVFTYDNGINTTLNDICDIYKHLGFNGLSGLIVDAIQEAKHREIYVLKEGEYLTQLFDRCEIPMIPEFLNGKLINSGTGTGKTELVNEFSKTHKTVLCVPNVTIIQNKVHKFRNDGSNVSGFYGDCTDLTGNEDLIICTVDSLPKLCTRIQTNDWCLSGDEIHAASTDDYKPKQYRNAIRQIKNFKAFFAMTGTPVFSAVPEIANLQKLTILSTRKAISYDIALYDDKEKEIASQVKKAVQEGKIPIVLLNSKSKAAVLNQTYLKDLDILYMDADSKNNPLQQQLMTSGIISEEIQGIITTTVLNAGSDINTPGKYKFIFDKFHSSTIAQLTGRARCAESLDVVLLKSKTARQSNVKFSPNEYGDLLRKTAQSKCNELNSTNPATDTEMIFFESELMKAIDSYPIRRNESGFYQVDLVKLSSSVIAEQTKHEYQNDYLQRQNLASYNFTYTPDETSTPEAITDEADAVTFEQIRAVKQEVKKVKREAVRTAKDKLKDSVNLISEARKTANGKTATKQEKIYAGWVLKLYESFRMTDSEIKRNLKAVTSENTFKEKYNTMIVERLANDDNFMKSNTAVSIFMQDIYSRIIEGEKYTAEQISIAFIHCLKSSRIFDASKYKTNGKADTRKCFKKLKYFFDLKRNGDKITWTAKKRKGNDVKINNLRHENNSILTTILVPML